MKTLSKNLANLLVKSVPAIIATAVLCAPVAGQTEVSTESHVVVLEGSERGFYVEETEGAIRLLTLGTPIEQDIRGKLDQPGEYDFESKLLSDVVAELEKQFEIQIQIDETARINRLADDEPIELQMAPGTAFRSYLRSVLEDYDCTYVVRNDSLVILSGEEAERQLVLRLYDVSATTMNHGELLDAITGLIAPDSWAKSAGGPADIKPLTIDRRRVLAIRQREDQHYQIEAFLNGLIRIGQTEPDRELR